MDIRAYHFSSDIPHLGPNTSGPKLQNIVDRAELGDLHVIQNDGPTHVRESKGDTVPNLLGCNLDQHFLRNRNHFHALVYVPQEQEPYGRHVVMRGKAPCSLDYIDRTNYGGLRPASPDRASVATCAGSARRRSFPADVHGDRGLSIAVIDFLGRACISNQVRRSAADDIIPIAIIPIIRVPTCAIARGLRR